MKNVNTLKYLFLLFIIILLTPINSLAIETISFLRTGMSTYEIENEIENIKPHGNEKKENPDIYNHENPYGDDYDPDNPYAEWEN